MTQVAITLAMAEPGAAPSPPDQSSILEPANRHLRGNQVALDVMGGSLGGRAVGQTFIVGTRVTYYPIRQLGIGGVYGYSRGNGGFEIVEGRSVHYAHGQLELPLVSALRIGRHRVLELDVFGQGGAGAIHIARAWQALGAVGGGVRLYPRVRWFAIRIDVLTYLHRTNRENTEVDADVAFTLGATFLLPSRWDRRTSTRSKGVKRAR